MKPRTPYWTRLIRTLSCCALYLVYGLALSCAVSIASELIPIYGNARVVADDRRSYVVIHEQSLFRDRIGWTWSRYNRDDVDAIDRIDTTATKEASKKSIEIAREHKVGIEYRSTSGFPFRSFSYTVLRNGHVIGGLPIGAWNPNSSLEVLFRKPSDTNAAIVRTIGIGQYERVLPFHVRVGPLLCNVVTMGVFMFVAVRSVVAIRSTVRRLQYRCPKCGYSLIGSASATCSECGASSSLHSP